MKKLVLGLIFFLTIILSSCGIKNQDVYNIIYEDQTFSIDTVNKTILHEDQTYKFDINGTTTTITFPDNSKYWWTQQDNIGFGGWSDDYKESKYVSGNILVKVLAREIPTNKNDKNYLLVAIFLALGVWNIVSPYSAWYASYGWRYKNAEPSEAAITITRIGGIFLILVGVIAIFI